jgi:beta-1,2-mannobiose phosphorylase / 1,2-beta-oligomannan phosphorylase
MPKVLKKQKKPVKKTIAKKKKNKVAKPAIRRKSAKKVKKVVGTSKLVRSPFNPIIEPRSYSWESKATLNPAAFLADGKIHLIYRAIGNDDVSVLGYASSLDGYNLDERPTHSIYHKYGKFVKSGEPINYISGGGWNGGCEDPRITLIDDTVYMLYTAFDGWGSLRIALTSIKLSDFRKKKWNWEKPILISPPGEIHKNWVLFPEKINGKFAILHSISPEILVDYIDDFSKFDGTRFIKSYYDNKPSWPNSWDNIVRGVGPTPIKTKVGWLILYHAMDRNDPNRYKLGAMILDFKDPTKILYRLPGPILEPDKNYENNGFKSGVIYSCGAVVKDGELFVYYGGADSVVCVASIKLSDLVDDLIKNKMAKLKKAKLFKPQ